MEIYKDKNIKIRTIEEKDRTEFLSLFNSEDFGCVGLNEEFKPSLSEENRVLTKIIDKEDIGHEILVIEDSDEFKGYISVDRPREYIYHIGHIAIKQNERKKGYGRLLIDTVKALANQEECDITLECLKSGRFFQKMGFDGDRIELCYTYKEEDSSINLNNKTHRIFVDYKVISEERNKQLEAEREKEIKSYQRFLDSPLAKSFFNK